MSTKFNRVLAAGLCLVMLIGIFPIGSIAYNQNFVSQTHDVFKHTESTIAPGVEQYTNYAYAKDSKQMVYYVATADISRDDVIVQTAYKDAQCTDFGMDKLTNQMAAANAKYSDKNNDAFISEYYQAVVGTNGDFYNMTTGQPTGAFVMDGVMSSNKANNRPWFAIFADGTALCGANNADWDAAVAAHGAAQQAVGGSEVLVKNGKDITVNASGSYNTDRHSRTMVGVTAEGKVVMAVLDGRQEPFSCGGNMHELAQIMLEAGCISAINLDGGGSTTFAARPEGRNAVEVINRPSDGSERSISTGLIIASTAVPSNVFDHATLTAQNEYVTPGSTVNVTATGVSPAGTAAQIPEGITYEATLGTVTADGVFTSNGEAGDAVVSMIYEGKVVGETTIHVVIPEKLTFDQEKMTVPFEKTVTLKMTANYGLNEVALKDGDVNFILSNKEIGTIDGFSFTASEEGAAATESDITAILAFDNTITANAKIELGKGSEVVFDFENGTAQGIGVSDGGYNYYLGNHSIQNVTAETGKVHSGNSAMAVNMDFTNSLESGYQRLSLYWKGPNDNESDNLYFEGATSLGMWIYIPDECVSLWARWMVPAITGVNEDGSYILSTNAKGEIETKTGQLIDGSINGQTGYVYNFEESGWHYLSIDLSAYKGAVIRNGYYFMQFYISDRAGDASTGYVGLKDKDSGQYCNVNGNYTFYIDDVTVDYSDAVDDREPPVFSEMNYGTTAMADAAAIAKRKIPTIAYDTVDFAAKVAENTEKNNATGLDISTAKAYVDGNEVACTYAGGVISMNESAVLRNGQHTIKFSICDNQGNYASIIRQVNIQAESNEPAAVKVVAHDSAADKVLLDSVQYIDVVANDISTVQSVKMTLDLDNMSKWELDHMEVAEGFEAVWTMTGADAAENIATLTITRTGKVTTAGESALVSIPVRMWALDNPVTVGNKTWDYAAFKESKETWPIAINLIIDQGSITFTDGTVDTFTGENIRIWSEMWGSYAYITLTDAGKAYWNAWNGGHTHNAAAIDDQAATCTENGYTNRTYCEVCNSVVDWGTTVPATGHTYEILDDVLQCSVCKSLCSGTFEGKTYVNGIPANGWINDSYYNDGVKLTGVQVIEDVYYDFGENGVCEGKTAYTGFLKQEDGWYYIAIGKIAKGWQYIDGEYYYFDPDTGLSWYGKQYYIYQQSYRFDEKGKVLEGLWVERNGGTLYYYGPSCYQRTWAEIDGSTYYFDIDGFRKEGVCWFYAGQSNNPPTWYEFTDDGKLVRIFDETGLLEANGNLYYLENGVNQRGLFQVDGNYYYFRSDDYTAVSGKYWVSNTNGLDIAPGYYDFDETTHAMIRDIKKNGLIVEADGTHFYVDGVQTYAGLVEADGCYYYINSTLKAVTGRYWVEKTNGLLDKGFYEFDADGKMKKN